MSDYKIDPKRVGDKYPKTGIFVRAKHKDTYDTYDLSELDKESMLSFARKCGCEKVLSAVLSHYE